MPDPITVEPELVAAEAARAKGKKSKGIYAAINAISADLAETGVSKSRTNAMQNYQFRGIDDVMNALAPLLVKHGVVILPRCLSRDVAERRTPKGTALFYVCVECEFDFICVADGSTHVVKMYGEAMDAGDKATNKAMSAAYKYAALQTFCIPTDTDADATTHPEVTTSAEAPLPAPPIAPPRPWKQYAAAPKPAPPPDVDTFGPPPAQSTVKIMKVEARGTKNPNVTRFLITTSTGEELATIRREFGAVAEECKAAHIPVWIEGRDTKYGRELMDIVAVPLPPNGPPELPVDEELTSEDIPF